jgi:predicted GNAT family acetyltransferase
MAGPAEGIEVDDVPAESRFVVRGSGGAAELVYHRNGKRLVLVHTEVPDTWEGRGVGGQLVRAAIRRARTEGSTLVPWCPFARRWLEEHPDERSDLQIDWETQPP